MPSAARRQVAAVLLLNLGTSDESVPENHLKSAREGSERRLSPDVVIGITSTTTSAHEVKRSPDCPYLARTMMSWISTPWLPICFLLVRASAVILQNTVYTMRALKEAQALVDQQAAAASAQQQQM